MKIQIIFGVFSQEESYHLACFFKRLELKYEKKENVRRTYRSIQNMLLGGKRSIACPYFAEGVVLDSKGNIQYCAPKSNIIGSALGGESYKLYRKNIDQRRKILKESCSDCIHDYHAPITAPEKLSSYKEFFYNQCLRIDSSAKTVRAVKVLKPFSKKIRFQPYLLRAGMEPRLSVIKPY